MFNSIQVDTILRRLKEASSGFYRLGVAMERVAAVQEASLSMLQRMDKMMDKAEPLVDHVIAMAKKEMEETKE